MLTNSLSASRQTSFSSFNPAKAVLAPLWNLISSYGKRLLPSKRGFQDPREQRAFNASREYQVARARCNRNF